MPLFAGHGVADPNYRPPRLPYVSVIGPLNLETESEREQPRTIHLWVQMPGHLDGAARAVTDAVPAAGALSLRLDGDAEGSVPVDFGALAGQPFDDAAGRQVAAAIESALISTIDAAGFSVDGVPVTDAARQTELRQTTVRWDRARHRIVVSSARRGILPEFEQSPRTLSRVEVLNGDVDPAASLGLGDGARSADGRIARHRVPNPAAVAVDMRLDLWAGSQQDLAVMFEHWARIMPVRGQLPIRPSLLAADVPDQSQAVQLLAGGEAPNRASLLQLEPAGFTDRRLGQPPTLANGAALDAGTLRFTATATASYLVFEPPPVPQAWDPLHPGANGFALSLGLRVDAGAAAGQAWQVLSLDHDVTVLRLALSYATVDGTLMAELQATANQADGTAYAAAVARVAATVLEAGADIHLIADARSGAVALFLDGQPLPADPATPAPGTPAGGHDMTLTLGDPGGATTGFRVTHLHLLGRPAGPVDPQLRRSTARATDWTIGDPIVLARSDDGYSVTGDTFGAVVVGVTGDTLQLDRPVPGDWLRGTTLVLKRSLFAFQKQLRRRDDLMNTLYRITLEYRVSTYLEDRVPGVSAPLAEITDVQVRDLARQLAEEADPDSPDTPVRPATGTPGIRSVIAEFRRNETRQ